MAKEQTTQWWTWVQFAVLIVSLTANVILWHKSEAYKASVDLATYNEKAWTAKWRLSEALESINKVYDGKLVALLDNPIEDYEAYFKSILSLEKEWKKSVKEAISEFRTKMHSYQGILQIELEAKPYAVELVSSLRSPFNGAISYLNGRVAESEAWARHNPQSRGGAYVVAGARKMKKFSRDLMAVVEGSHSELVNEINR